MFKNSVVKNLSSEFDSCRSNNFIPISNFLPPTNSIPKFLSSTNYIPISKFAPNNNFDLYNFNSSDSKSFDPNSSNTKSFDPNSSHDPSLRTDSTNKVNSFKPFAFRNPDYVRFKSLKGGIYTIEGIIGVGKTTFGRSVESYLNEIGISAKFFPEYVNKQLLTQYIGDMPRYAYAFQMIMLCKRIEIYRQAELFASTGGVAFIDRSIIGDLTFARMQKDNGNFTSDEWDIYLSLMKQDIQMEPTASIYLKCSTKTALKRINRRGIRSEIEGYTPEYIEQLRLSYELSFRDDLVSSKRKRPDEEIFGDLRKRGIEVINSANNYIIIDWNIPVTIENNLLTKDLTYKILDQLVVF